MALNFFLAI